MNDQGARLGLFQGYGVELEYMIVHRDSLAVLPVADRLIHAVAGDYLNEVEQGPLAWSNELVLHVLELKTNGPAPDLTPLAEQFLADLRRIDALLEPLGGRLMPTAMHPWMDPHRETRLWPHGQDEIYQAYDRIFGCQGHGWSNLQSVHLNLPFAGDQEFTRLHAAIRVLLPVLPALAASSPIVEGAATGFMDSRLEAYRRNQARIPAIAGAIIPEPVAGEDEYRRRILEPMYQAIAPHDPEGILQDEWLNSRGAIARFDRSAIEIRVLDIQECPAADLALMALIAAVLKDLAAGRWAPLAAQQALDTGSLAELLLAAARDAEQTVIRDRRYLRALGYPERDGQARDLWWHLRESCLPGGGPWKAALELLLTHGPLSRRILKAVGPGCPRGRVEATYRRLCHCLLEGEQFLGLD